jgi:hypothetical protein
LLYYIPQRQEEVVSKIGSSHNGFGYSSQGTGYYTEKNQFNSNNMLLVRKNFCDRNNKDNYYRDVYVDFYGDIFLFDNDDRYPAHEHLNIGSKVLYNLVFEQKIGYYICLRNEEFWHINYTLIARFTTKEISEKYGSPIPPRTTQEALEVSSRSPKEIDKKIEARLKELNDRPPETKDVRKIAENLGIVGSFDLHQRHRIWYKFKRSRSF